MCFNRNVGVCFEVRYILCRTRKLGIVMKMNYKFELGFFTSKWEIIPKKCSFILWKLTYWLQPLKLILTSSQSLKPPKNFVSQAFTLVNEANNLVNKAFYFFGGVINLINEANNLIHQAFNLFDEANNLMDEAKSLLFKLKFSEIKLFA